VSSSLGGASLLNKVNFCFTPSSWQMWSSRMSSPSCSVPRGSTLTWMKNLRLDPGVRRPLVLELGCVKIRLRRRTVHPFALNLFNPVKLELDCAISFQVARRPFCHLPNGFVFARGGVLRVSFPSAFSRNVTQNRCMRPRHTVSARCSPSISTSKGSHGVHMRWEHLR